MQGGATAQTITDLMLYRPSLFFLTLLSLVLTATHLAHAQTAAQPELQLGRLGAGAGAARSIVFILVDDLRPDVFSFAGHPFIETPHIDALAKEGVVCKNAFVTTALCSPSRASILTGLYAHKHGVVDNNNPVRADLVFFPQYLQQAGYETALIGKWHMGGEQAGPQRGFHRWVSFPGQGHYEPGRRGMLNIDGTPTPQKGYITDELTDYALDWLQARPADKPFFLYLSHKAVHSEFIPADRHKGRYANKAVRLPETYADTPENYAGKPRWVKDQRNSWHGVDFPYHSTLDVPAYYRRYCETLLAVDDSIGRLVAQLKSQGRLDSTLIALMGDNGFMFGEHGLIDKRTAYDASMRVPLIMRCPEMIKGGSELPQVVANIDIAPTLLETAGLQPPAHMQGRSFLPLARGESAPWRDGLLYEYYWEKNFPQTPTVHALRGERYKYIRVQGLWDIDELYDLQADPQEKHNLIGAAEHAATVRQMNRRLFEVLRETDGLQIPLLPDGGGVNNKRRADGAEAGEFPPGFFDAPAPRGRQRSPQQ